MKLAFGRQGFGLSFFFLILLTSPLWATDIEGVLPAGADMPKVNMVLRATPNGDPLQAADGSTIIEAYFDTGASGILLSQETGLSTAGLHLPTATFDGTPVTFEDAGVGGEFAADVSQFEYYYSLATYDIGTLFGEPPVFFNQTFSPARLQLNPTPSGDLGPLDIVGTPAMIGRVVVLDPKPLEPQNIEDIDFIHTKIYTPGDSAIPTTNRHVKLTMPSFDRFTQTLPSNATPPTLAPNPIIGPDPVHKLDSSVPAGDAPGVTVAFQGNSLSGSFLVDTGAQVSMISLTMASSLHVRYRAGHELGTDEPLLETFDPNHPENPGGDIPGQFVVPVGGLGGDPVAAAGFHLGSLSVPTVEGDPINFLDAPVLVADISALDYGGSGQTLYLDGVFGMNFMAASTDLLMSDMRAGAFNWVVFNADPQNPVLGLDLKGVPEPATLLLLALAAVGYLARRMLRPKPT